MAVCDETKPYIFISYSHKDSAKVVDIINRLRGAGYNVWYDEGIDPGTEWDENIARHVQECSYFIAFVSNGYIGSKNCKDELNYSRDLDKDQLLVYLEDVELPGGMAMRMNRIQAIWWNKYDSSNIESAYEKLFSASGIEKTKISDGANVEPIEIPNVKVSDNTSANVSDIKTVKTGGIIPGLDNKVLFGIVGALVVVIIIAIAALGGKKDNSSDANTASDMQEAAQDMQEAAEDIQEALGDVQESTDEIEEAADTDADKDAYAFDNIEFKEFTITGPYGDVSIEMPSSIGYNDFPGIRMETDSESMGMRDDGNGKPVGLYLFYDLYFTMIEKSQNTTTFENGYACYDDNDELIDYKRFTVVDKLSNEKIADKKEELEIGNKYTCWGWVPIGTRKIKFFSEAADGQDCYKETELKAELDKKQGPYEFNVKTDFGDLIVKTNGVIQDSVDNNAKGYVVSVQNPQDRNETFYDIDYYLKALSSKSEDNDSKNKLFFRRVCYDKDDKIIFASTDINCFMSVDESPITANSMYMAKGMGVRKGTTRLEIANWVYGEFFNISYKDFMLEDDTQAWVACYEGYEKIHSMDDNTCKWDIDMQEVKLSEDGETLDVTLYAKDIENPNGAKNFRMGFECWDESYKTVMKENYNFGLEDGKVLETGTDFGKITLKVPASTRTIHLFGNYPDGRDLYN